METRATDIRYWNNAWDDYSYFTLLREDLMNSTPDEAEKIFINDDFSPYDIADVVKEYFRSLPERLITAELSHIFIAIFGELN